MLANFRLSIVSLFILNIFMGWSLIWAASPPEVHTPLFPLGDKLDDELQFIQEETVVTPLRREQPISEAPSNVYVISAEDIRTSGATDIPTLLRRVPGMEVMQTTGADFNVSVRGNNQLAANRILVLIDGRSIYIDGQGIVLWQMVPVTFPEIERIEVLKGPASAVYGFNAFDGVVNIITKSPEKLKGTTLQVGSGEFDTIRSAAVHAGTQQRFGYRFSAGWDQNHQWDNRNGLAFRAYKFNFLTEYSFEPGGTLSASGGFLDSNRFDGLLVGPARFSTQLSHAYADLLYEHSNLLVRFSWNRHATASDPDYGSVRNLLKQVGTNGRTEQHAFFNTYNTLGQYHFPIGSHRMTIGGNYRLNTVAGDLTAQFRKEHRLGLYVQDEWAAIDNVTVVSGFRYELDSFINPTISARLTIIFKPIKGHSFSAGISVAYRPPSLIETYYRGQILTILPSPFPSPPPEAFIMSTGLGPEQLISYTVGYQGWYLRHRLRLRFDVFYNHISDLITASGPILINGREADIYGGELGVEFWATSWLSGFVNFAWQEIHQTIPESDRRVGPRPKVNFGLRGYWNDTFSMKIGIHHHGSVTYPLTGAFQTLAPFGVISPNPHVESYTLLDLRVGWWFWNKQAEFAISVFNALNDRHREHPLGEVIGSRVMGWLTVMLPTGNFDSWSFGNE